MQFKELEFDWDDGNSHKIKLRFRLEEVEEFFFQQLLIKPDKVHSQQEEREIAMGRGPAGKAMLVCFTMRENKIRVISARFMNTREVSDYEKIKKE